MERALIECDDRQSYCSYIPSFPYHLTSLVFRYYLIIWHPLIKYAHRPNRACSPQSLPNPTLREGKAREFRIRGFLLEVEVLDPDHLRGLAR